jgi:hypothetical protein
LEPAETITELMTQFRHGDQQAAAKLTEVLYPELRRIAAASMRRERIEHSWQPTLLVNELYLKPGQERSGPAACPQADSLQKSLRRACSCAFHVSGHHMISDGLFCTSQVRIHHRIGRTPPCAYVRPHLLDHQRGSRFPGKPVQSPFIVRIKDELRLSRDGRMAKVTSVRLKVKQNQLGAVFG